MTTDEENCAVCGNPLGSHTLVLADGRKLHPGCNTMPWDAKDAQIAALTAKVAELRADFAAEIQQMSEAFRAVNIERVIEATGTDFVTFAKRVETAETEAAQLRVENERLQKAVDYEAGEPGTVEYHKSLFARLDKAEAAEKRIAEVEAERDKLIASTGEHITVRSEYRARIDQLESALRPFAAISRRLTEAHLGAYEDDDVLVPLRLLHDAHDALAGLSASGPDLVKETARRCVEIARDEQTRREQLYAENGASINAHRAAAAEAIATTIAREFSLEDGE